MTSAFPVGVLASADPEHTATNAAHHNACIARTNKDRDPPLVIIVHFATSVG